MLERKMLLVYIRFILFQNIFSLVGNNCCYIYKKNVIAICVKLTNIKISRSNY